MIYQILKQIRLDNGYHAKAIAKLLNLTTKQFTAYETSYKEIPSSLLQQWIKHLDIPPQDHPWYIQRNHREYVMQRLSLSFPFLSKIWVKRLADVIVFHLWIEQKDLLQSQILKQTLSHIIRMPRSADVAMDKIKDADK